MMRGVAALAVASSVLLSTTFATGQSHPGGVAPPELTTARSDRVDPGFEAIRLVMAAEGPRSPYFGGPGLPVGTRVDGVGALLRFARPLAGSELERLRDAGVEWQSRDGRIVRVGNVYGAFVRFAALPHLGSHPELVLAEVAWHPVSLRPLEQTTEEIGADRSRGIALPGATGEGTVIGDIDSGVDVLHPHFFHADGGAFRWVDVNEDGELTPLVDAIDFDGDGNVGSNEIVRVLDAVQVGPANVVEGDDGELDIGRDWVYLDANQDGARNVGVNEGFTEFDAGYGEPAFVPDDANRNGALDPDERLLLLGTSKIRRFVTTERTWRRGEDLIRSEGVEFINQVLHGTAVASILVGGQPALDRVGVAPGADLVMYSSHMDAPGGGFEESGHLADLQDAEQNGVDVLVHEWTNPSTATIDGSGNYEAAMQAARDSGVVHVNPLGNLNLSRKHIERDALSGGAATLVFTVGGGFEVAGEVLPYSSIFGSLYWRADQQPTFVLANSLGDSVTLPLDGSIVSIGADQVQATFRTSSRGTRHLQFSLWNADMSTSVAPGDWSFEISDIVADDRFVGRIADFWSGWSVGVFWVDATQGRGTGVYPATADAAIGVAAYGGRHELSADGTGPGELRAYSGRGPRIDGAPLVHLAAPDDPFTAWGVSPDWLATGVGRSWFTVFGGTSGATPHVAGAAALIRAADPRSTPDDVEQRLLGTARRDDFTGDSLPNADWGAGKLDVFAAVHGTPRRPNNGQPTAGIERNSGEPVRVSAAPSFDPDGDTLMFRWDFDYDGTWDTDWQTATDPDVTFEAGVEHFVRLDVRDDQGGWSGAILRLDLAEPGADVEAGDVGIDLGPVDEIPPSRCGCASASEGGFWGLVWGALFVGVRRRRRRRS